MKVAEKRPTEADIDLSPVYKKLAEYVSEETGADIETSMEAVEELSSYDLTSSNGYEICKELEMSNSWIEPTSTLVEYMDTSCYLVSELHDKAIEEWVERFGIVPGKTEGDLAYDLSGNLIGEIVDVKHDRAIYCVKKEDRKSDLRYIGTYYNFEDVK